MRETCRYCENKRKEGVDWYDSDYCSGKCKKQDGGAVAPEIKAALATGEKASLDDYLLDYPKGIGEKDRRGQRIKGRVPKRYRRRYQPEELNWGEPLTPCQLSQAGLRENREPIPGDYDYSPTMCATEIAAAPPNEWDQIRAKAKELGITTHGKKKEQVLTEIQEKENE